MNVKTTLFVAGMALSCELIGARVLDEIGLIEGLLSPSDASSALLVPLAVAFFAARLLARFVVPGLVLGALVVSFRHSVAQRN